MELSAETIDHVTVAGPTLGALVDALRRYGLDPAYGGEHDNGVTEMAAVGFPDGSYLELISSLDLEQTAPLWDGHIREHGGPCGWAVVVDDLGATLDTLWDRGVTVEGPTRLSRERPDGTELAWSMAFLGPGDPGSRLPFLITDHTPREARAQPGRGCADTGLTGVKRVVVGVDALDAAVDRYRTAFALDAPTRRAETQNGLAVARFADAPVDLVAPDGAGWLADRLAALGPSPAAFLLGAEPTAPIRDRVQEAGPDRWLGRDVGWLDVTGRPGLPDLGVRL